MKIILSCLSLILCLTTINASDNGKMPVSVEKAQKHILINSINTFGAVKNFPSSNAKASTLFNGVLIKKYYKLGDKVKKNALLATIETKKAKILAKIGGYHIKNINILAPINGYIIQDFATIGSIINQGVTIVQIASNNNKYISISVPNRYAKKIQKDLKVIIDCNGQKYNTKITKIIPITNPLNDTFIAIAPVKENNLYTGNVCKTTLIFEKKNVLALRRDAILSRDDKNFIFVVQGNIAKEKQVKLGIKTDKYIEIQSGVSKGENIVILGNYELKNDMKVRIIKK